MKYKEAERQLNDLRYKLNRLHYADIEMYNEDESYGYDFDSAIHKAIYALMYCRRYMWHDLKCDSDDLPEDGYLCLVAIEFDYGVKYYQAYFKNGEFKVEHKDKIVEWKYLETISPYNPQLEDK